MMSKIKITLVRSAIGRPQTQRKTLKGMGLTRMHRTVVLQDSAEIRGMIRKVSHLVEVAPMEENES